METVARLFREWLDRRGTGALESAKALAQVRSMIEKHGASRFVPWNPAELPPIPSQPVQNRMGFVRRDGEQTTFFVMPEAFKRDICKGLDPARVARELIAIGAITPDANRKTSTKVRLPGLGSVRCLVIDAAKLFAD
jgi:putative DNA primase/helicase